MHVSVENDCTTAICQTQMGPSALLSRLQVVQSPENQRQKGTPELENQSLELSLPLPTLSSTTSTILDQRWLGEYDLHVVDEETCDGKINISFEMKPPTT
jgi:hypothetical protein